MPRRLRFEMLPALGAIAAAGLFAATAPADLIEIADDPASATEGLGHFTGTLDYRLQGGAWILSVDLTNTSDPSNGGYITGFLFNIDSRDDDAEAELFSASHGFFEDAEGESGQPFGSDYDAGAALNGNWLGGGKPSRGIAVGDTGSFQFEIEADDASFLTASSFMNGPYEYDFVVRFRGFEDGGSDKVGGAVVPAPGAAALLLAGSGLIVTGRRRRPRD
ncbi:MAG: hypothetical protein ACF8PN_05570 [Phycisphaerales bacterium]